MKLDTKFLGLDLKNPLIVASSDLSKNVDNIKKMEKAGAGAVVLKSIFQEQLEMESASVNSVSPDFMGEMYDYVKNYSENNGLREYLDLIKSAKDAVSIPIIASVNCNSAEGWVDYAKKMEDVGADALEVNVAILPDSKFTDSAEIENEYFKLAERLKKELNIPVAFKIGPFFTSVLKMATMLSAKGVDGLVLFNRFYQFDIDIEKMNIKAGNPLSSSMEISNTLRWVAILYGKIDADLAATTGVHNADGAIKQLLAGAKAVELCSTLYKNGIEHIGVIREGIEKWMREKGFSSIDEFRGKVSQENSEYPGEYERLQYMKALTSWK